MNLRPPLLLLALSLTLPLLAQEKSFDPVPSLERNNVTWHEPGTSSADSMPLGNGDLALNVWTEPSGDLLFYISKTDAWSEKPSQSKGLVKLARVRVSVQPAVLGVGTPFVQTLRLHEAAIEVTEGAPGQQVRFHLWVDANHPVVHLQMEGDHPFSAKAALEIWRTTDQNGISADTVASDPEKNQLIWYHRDQLKPVPQVANLTFGGLIQGAGWKSQDATTLVTAAPTQKTDLSLTALTATTPTPEAWLGALGQLVTQTQAVPVGEAWHQHLAWWDAFWHRSWIFLEGDEKTQAVGQGYVLQRFVTACAGRGAYPIKFNGSLFVVDSPTFQPDKKSPPGVDADFRSWGGQYWFQNTRAMYWPRLMAGDEDLMLPLFRMYQGELAANATSVQTYYHHEGSYVAETAPFWGGIPNLLPQGKGSYTMDYFTPVLELTQMGLDDYDYTGDEDFLQKTVLPIATAGLLFFDHHFPRDAAGQLLLDPDNSIEMYWKVHDPLPDIVALHTVLERLLALPAGRISDSDRAKWEKLKSILPDLPSGLKDGKTVLLPYTGDQTQPHHNTENPELYAIYPYRRFGLGLPQYQLASATFDARLIKNTGCWVQDPIQAAMLGLTDLAEKDVTFDLTRRDPSQKFPAFWDKGHDYLPDEDNGGNGENGLQWMLLMPRGKTLYFLPAWPKTWTAHFKLHAPDQTTVEGTVKDGKISDLVVTPERRKADVVILDDTAKANLMQK